MPKKPFRSPKDKYQAPAIPADLSATATNAKLISPSEIASKLIWQMLRSVGLSFREMDRVLHDVIKKCRVERYSARGPRSLDEQEWRQVLRDGMEKYQVSSWGFVRWKQREPPIKPDQCHAYPRARLKGKGVLIHVLVYECFGLERTFASLNIDDKNAECVINHKDGDKWNPAFDNLELITQEQNMIHAYGEKLRQPRQ